VGGLQDKHYQDNVHHPYFQMGEICQNAARAIAGLEMLSA
jgi:hypothetical protein